MAAHQPPSVTAHQSPSVTAHQPPSVTAAPRKLQDSVTAAPRKLQTSVTAASQRHPLYITTIHLPLQRKQVLLNDPDQPRLAQQIVMLRHHNLTAIYNVKPTDVTQRNVVQLVQRLFLYPRTRSANTAVFVQNQAAAALTF